MTYSIIFIVIKDVESATRTALMDQLAQTAHSENRLVMAHVSQSSEHAAVEAFVITVHTQELYGVTRQEALVRISGPV